MKVNSNLYFNPTSSTLVHSKIFTESDDGTDEYIIPSDGIYMLNITTGTMAGLPIAHNLKAAVNGVPVAYALCSTNYNNAIVIFRLKAGTTVSSYDMHPQTGFYVYKIE